jgi:starvation-inducible DNA-binding protein
VSAVTDDDLRQDLQAALGLLFDLRVLGDEAKAHFIGTRFSGMQRQLEDVVQTAADAGDAVSGLLRTIGGDSEGRMIITPIQLGVPSLTPGERCMTTAVNTISKRIIVAINTIRCIHRQCGSPGTPIAQMLQAITEALDERARTLASESRSVESASCSADAQV